MGKFWKNVRDIWQGLCEFAESCKADNLSPLPPEPDVEGRHIYFYDCDAASECPDEVVVEDKDDEIESPKEWFPRDAESIRKDYPTPDAFDNFVRNFVKTRLSEIPAQPCCHTCSADVTQEHIAQKAYFLWEAAGKPDGRSDEFWQEATLVLTGKPETVDLKFDVYVEPLVRRAY